MSGLKLLETPRLILNDLVHEDATALFKLFSNDAVLQFIDVKKLTSIEQAHHLIEKMHSRLRNGLGYRYAIRLKSGTLIGSFGVNQIVYDHCQCGAVIGCELFPDFWQQGYMSEVLDCILIEFKENLVFGKKIDFIVAEVYPHNLRSQALLLKYQFQQVKSDIEEQIYLDLEISSRLIFKYCLG